MKQCYVLPIVLFFCGCSIFGQFSEKKKGYQQFEGYFDFYHDSALDKIFLTVDRLDQQFLYVYALSSGIGSNDIGLDRGQLGNEQVVFFEKAGGKLFLVQPNLSYRALTDNALEQASVKQAFAKSILGSFKIIEEKNGSYVIDITDFLMRDAHGVAQRLKQTAQGKYTLDKDKSALAMERTVAFPNNIEFDVTLTFKGTPQGDFIKSVSPNPSLVTVAQHHSFIKLPGDGYEQRAFDPRSGAYPFAYYDYASPVQEPILKRFITRHRLQKKNPEAERSEAVDPIVYYLDNGTPEPVRSALMEGGRWWNQAFEALGYENAFQLKILPDDADPLDVRYNVIQWVHRSTRGWSYGSSITDPRTGEIIKGHVSLGSLRIRQDFMIAQALTNRPFGERDDNDEKLLEMALSRIRQLSAHEIGHTLGFAHNYAASANNRASVMDYPHPQFTISGDDIDFSNAYAVGIGAWDKVAVAYSYTDFGTAENESEELSKILEDAQNKGLRYITDQDARPMGSAHAIAHLWDNGMDIVSELEALLAVRKKAIGNFSIDNIRDNEPNTVLEDVFVPLYFFHRYQTEAVAKRIGGLEYNYAVKGDGQEVVSVLAALLQKKALTSVLNTLDAAIIAIPKEKLKLFPPRAFGYPRTRESFKGKTGVSFDALSAPETAADMSLVFVLHPERSSRLIQQKALDPSQLGLETLQNELLKSTFGKSHKDPYLTTVQQNINFRVLQHLMNLAVQKGVHPQVNAITHATLQKLKTDYARSTDVFEKEVVRRIDNFQKHPEKFKVFAVPKIPDGSPIGMDCFHG